MASWYLLVSVTNSECVVFMGHTNPNFSLPMSFSTLFSRNESKHRTNLSIKSVPDIPHEYRCHGRTDARMRKYKIIHLLESGILLLVSLRFTCFAQKLHVSRTRHIANCLFVVLENKEAGLILNQRTTTKLAFS